MNVFDYDENVARYESWFEKHPAVFQSEINLLRKTLPAGIGFEVGIGWMWFVYTLKQMERISIFKDGRR